MFKPALPLIMELQSPNLLSQQDLAKRWGRSATAIGLFSAIGLGPRYVKYGGALMYPIDEVQKYERRAHMMN